MQKILDFLRQHYEVAMATVGTDGLPKIRVSQIMKQVKSDLYFATSPHKEVYSQLQTDPHVELLAMSGTTSVRIAGAVRFDVPDAIGREIYNTTPILRRLYTGYDQLVYFRLPIATADYFDTSPTPALHEHFKCFENTEQE